MKEPTNSNPTMMVNMASLLHQLPVHNQIRVLGLLFNHLFNLQLLLAPEGRLASQVAALESTQQRSFHDKDGYYAANSATSEQTITPDEAHDNHLLLQKRMRHSIAFHAEMMGDIMYYHQAMQQDDADEFVGAIVKEVNGHAENNN